MKLNCLKEKTVLDNVPKIVHNIILILYGQSDLQNVALDDLRTIFRTRYYHIMKILS